MLPGLQNNSNGFRIQFDRLPTVTFGFKTVDLALTERLLDTPNRSLMSNKSISYD